MCREPHNYINTCINKPIYMDRVHGNWMYMANFPKKNGQIVVC